MPALIPPALIPVARLLVATRLAAATFLLAVLSGRRILLVRALLLLIPGHDDIPLFDARYGQRKNAPNGELFHLFIVLIYIKSVTPLPFYSDQSHLRQASGGTCRNVKGLAA